MNAVPHLNVKVNDDEIVVTQNGSDFVAVYRLADYEPELNSKGKLLRPARILDAGVAGRRNEKARELGWIV